MAKHQPIGVFDSGIGGLTVVQSIMRYLPNERIIYFGDTGRCPYGDRTPDEVLSFSREILDYLYGQGVKLLVVACNSATAAALPHLKDRYDVPVIGVIQPGVRAALGTTKSGRIGVIGTSVTIQSGAYQRAVVERLPTAKVVGLACPAFVPLVESGKLDGDETEQIVRDSLEPLKVHEIDTLILGCTHYPLLQEVIGRVVGPSVRLISSATETALEVKNLLESRGELTTGPRAGANQYFTSGDGTRMEMALAQWIHIEKSGVHVNPVRLPISEDLKVASNASRMRSDSVERRIPGFV